MAAMPAHTVFYALLSVTLVSLLSLIGIFFLGLDEARLRRMLLSMVSFATGGLFGDAFFHLLPVAIRAPGAGPMTSLWVILGILIFFVLEKFIRWRHCHVPESSAHTHPVVAINFIGESAHNLIDGLLIGASYVAAPSLGLATTLAVILHEIPHEIGNFGVYVHGGLKVRKALLANFLSALTAVLGTLASLYLGTHLQHYSQALVPLTAGGFIYVAGSDLIPELQHEVAWRVSLGQLIWMLAGLGMMASILALE
jgi:zinc and cadmium transporter